MADPKPMTPAEMRERARLIRANLDRHIQELRDEAEKEAQELEAAALVVERYQGGLSREQDYATLATMEASANVATAEKRVPGRQIVSAGPAAKVAKALGVSMKELARLTKYAHGTVRSWDSRGKIPDDAKPRFDALLATHAEKQAIEAKGAAKKSPKSAK